MNAEETADEVAVGVFATWPRMKMNNEATLTATEKRRLASRNGLVDSCTAVKSLYGTVLFFGLQPKREAMWKAIYAVTNIAWIQ
jgi:hypothetical protein